MLFCIVRLGKDSKQDIDKLDSMQGPQTDAHESNLILITCKQVPNEVISGTYCFIWLGSDNNKGAPTPWKQGLKAFGKILNKTSTTNRNDDTTLTIRIGMAFKKALNKIDILRSAKENYISISNIPVIGLNTSSNQTVQLIRPNEENQNLDILIASITAYQSNFNIELKERYPELEDITRFSVKENLTISRNYDVEDTDDSSSETIIPFDPNLIKLRRDPYTLGELIDRMEHEEINYLTGFQRKADLWNDVQQSRLIESILLRLPLPAFYFEETTDNIWQVIDGLQRTTALKRFIVDEKLILKDLEFLKDCNGLKFSQLPRDLNRRIRTSPLTVYVLERGTPEEVKFNIFKRINTGGIVLTSQEIRHALNQGVPADFIQKLAELEEFKKATAYSINNERMEDREFVNRFIAFSLINFFEYEPDLDSFLTKGIAKLKYTSKVYRDEIEIAFKKAMRSAYIIFGTDAFRKRQKVEDKRRPINKALFEVISVVFSQLTNNEMAHLIGKKNNFKEKFIILNNDQEFIGSISSGTGNKSNIITRFSKFKDAVTELLNDSK